MKFQILLFILGRKLKGKVKNDPDFKKKAAEKNCTVQIKSADNKKGRYYTFKDGEVASKKGIAADPTVALVWKDAATGFAVLSSGDAAKNMEAIQNGNLKFEGDGGTALWFAGIAKGAR